MAIYEQVKSRKIALIIIGVLALAVVIAIALFFYFKTTQTAKEVTIPIKKPVYPTDLRLKVERPANPTPLQSLTLDLTELKQNNHEDIAAQEAYYFANTAASSDDRRIGYLESGIAYANEGNYKYALQAYLNAEKIFGNKDPQIESGIALVADQAGQRQVAIDAYRRLIVLSKATNDERAENNIFYYENRLRTLGVQP